MRNMQKKAKGKNESVTEICCGDFLKLRERIGALNGLLRKT